MKHEDPSLVHVRSYDTGGRGLLNVLNESEFPFPIRRLFWITRTDQLAKRGGHAHREGFQFIVPLSGRATVKSIGRQLVETKWDLYMPCDGLLVPPMNWLDIRIILPETSLLVLASNAYAESDYIRDWSEFETLARSL